MSFFNDKYAMTYAVLFLILILFFCLFLLPSGIYTASSLSFVHSVLAG